MKLGALHRATFVLICIYRRSLDSNRIYVYMKKCHERILTCLLAYLHSELPLSMFEHFLAEF